MTSLVTADGRLLKRTGPARNLLGIGTEALTWTDRTDAEGLDEDFLVGYHTIYETQPLIAAAVNKLCRQAAALPLKVYRRRADNDREAVGKDHELQRLLDRPLPRFSRMDFAEWALLPMLVHGNAVIAKFREDPEGPPTGLIPVDWRFLEAYAPQGGFVEWWATNQTGQTRWFQAEDSLHFHWHSTAYNIGISPLKQLAVTIRAEDGAQRYAIASLRNGIRPSAAVTVPESANMRDADARQFYREQVEALHKGVDRAGKFALLSPGADIKVLQFSAADAQLIQQREVAREEVEMVYDLPGPLLGDLKYGTLANVSELHKQLYKSVLRPWLTLIEETLQAQLIDPEPRWEGLYAEFEMAEQLKGDPLAEAQALKTLIESGLLTPNEGRRIQNHPPQGDPSDPENPANQLHLQMNNMAPIGPAPTSDPVATT